MSLTWPDQFPSCGPIVLRPFHDSDLSLVADLATDPYIPLIGTVPVPFTEEDGLAYLARQHQRLTDGTGYSFAVADCVDDYAVGSAGLWLKDLDAGRAAAGYCVAPRARGHGFAMAALTALTEFGWTLRKLHRIELYIEPWNAGSIKTAERCGYAREGLLRQHQEIGGARRDMLLYAAIR